jgi:RimJ/RimL family protein N-acetyltransferase
VPWSDEKIQSFVTDQIELYSERGFCRWKLVDKQSGGFVGFCGTGYWRDEPDPEIGWWLARPSWGRGLATEAARVAMADAFERVKLNRIISIARPKNLASIRIMHKLGLKLDSEFERDGVQLVKYALNRCDYAALSR